MKKKKDPIKCAKCNVELSIKEVHSSAVVNYEGDYYGNPHHLCFICRGEELHKMGFKS